MINELAVFLEGMACLEHVSGTDCVLICGGMAGAA